jgi:hypothetical protein
LIGDGGLPLAVTLKVVFHPAVTCRFAGGVRIDGVETRDTAAISLPMFNRLAPLFSAMKRTPFRVLNR